ncbi:hypothetical protein Bamb_3631 [Burkholderia ambifaria AMMD]|uniref:Uncharacterized protein n=1 Tax=Burkholderia ambifaria (strain ATCC BAA-244 / DSM 16087 / CCUG 44356 / LMG 19182 / AMMD) TaxID=339670 RepID=Q0B9I8_BURCM|nr:hypothetical protein Bamb_3631 [Burkholderia ambifaria AMMD]
MSHRIPANRAWSLQRRNEATVHRGSATCRVVRFIAQRSMLGMHGARPGAPAEPTRQATRSSKYARVVPVRRNGGVRMTDLRRARKSMKRQTLVCMRQSIVCARGGDVRPAGREQSRCSSTAPGFFNRVRCRRPVLRAEQRPVATG